MKRSDSFFDPFFPATSRHASGFGQGQLCCCWKPLIYSWVCKYKRYQVQKWRDYWMQGLSHAEPSVLPCMGINPEQKILSLMCDLSVSMMEAKRHPPVPQEDTQFPCGISGCLLKYRALPQGHKSEAVNKNSWKKQVCLAEMRRRFTGQWYLQVMQCHAGHNAPYSRRAKILHKVALFHPDITPFPACQTLYYASQTLGRRK